MARVLSKGFQADFGPRPLEPKFRDGHRKLVQKTIEDATGLITVDNPIEVKRLKFLRTALETKYSELQSLDSEIVDLVGDVKVVIQECIVELKSIGSSRKSGKEPGIPFCGATCVSRKQGNFSRSRFGSFHSFKVTHALISFLGIFHVCGLQESKCVFRRQIQLSEATSHWHCVKFGRWPSPEEC